MPRAGLTRDRVVAEAASVADDVGLDRLTLAAVAERFGVALPSLYKHVRGLDGLRRDLAVSGLHRLHGELSRATVGRSGRDALHGMAAAYRRFAQAHPGAYAATTRAPDPDDPDHVAVAGEVLDVVFAVLAGYGIEGADAVDATRALRAAMHGFVTLEAGEGFKMPQDLDRSYERLVDALDVAFRSWACA